MADIFKKPGVLIAIAVALVLIIGGVIYMVWRKVSLLEMRNETHSSEFSATKADISKLQNEIRNRDEKISEMKDKIAALDKQLTELRVLGKIGKAPKKVKTKCDDELCTLDVISDDE